VTASKVIPQETATVLTVHCVVFGITWHPDWQAGTLTPFKVMHFASLVIPKNCSLKRGAQALIFMYTCDGAKIDQKLLWKHS